MENDNSVTIERTPQGITFQLEAGNLLLTFDEVEMMLIYPERCKKCNHLVIFHRLERNHDCIVGSCRCNTEVLVEGGEEPWWKKHNLSTYQTTLFSGV